MLPRQVMGILSWRLFPFGGAAGLRLPRTISTTPSKNLENFAPQFPPAVVTPWGPTPRRGDQMKRKFPKIEILVVAYSGAQVGSLLSKTELGLNLIRGHRGCQKWFFPVV